MTADMKEMIFIFSTWGSNNLDWLQHGSCTGTCDPSYSGAVISNISIMSQQLVPKSMSPLSALDPGPSTLDSAQGMVLAAALAVLTLLVI